MKNYFYKNPLFSVILSNILTSFIVLFSLNNDKYYLLGVLFIDLYINNWIINKGISITKTKIILMSISFYGMLLISILCNKYVGVIKL